MKFLTTINAPCFKTPKDPDVYTWVYYDGPQILTCRTIDGKLALCCTIGDIKNGEKYIGVKWLVTILEEDEWKKIKNRELTLNQTYDYPKKIFIVNQTFKNKKEKLTFYQTLFEDKLRWADDVYLFNKEESKALRQGTYFK